MLLWKNKYNMIKDEIKIFAKHVAFVGSNVLNFYM